jgi:hypothetical protein
VWNWVGARWSGFGQTLAPLPGNQALLFQGIAPQQLEWRRRVECMCCIVEVVFAVRVGKMMGRNACCRDLQATQCGDVRPREKLFFTMWDVWWAWGGDGTKASKLLECLHGGL